MNVTRFRLRCWIAASAVAAAAAAAASGSRAQSATCDDARPADSDFAYKLSGAICEGAVERPTSAEFALRSFSDDGVQYDLERDTPLKISIDAPEDVQELMLEGFSFGDARPYEMRPLGKVALRNLPTWKVKHLRGLGIPNSKVGLRAYYMRNERKVYAPARAAQTPRADHEQDYSWIFHVGNVALAELKGTVELQGGGDSGSDVIPAAVEQVDSHVVIKFRKPSQRGEYKLLLVGVVDGRPRRPFVKAYFFFHPGGAPPVSAPTK